MPLLLDDFTHARTCKPFCEKYLTLPRSWSGATPLASAGIGSRKNICHKYGQRDKLLRPVPLYFRLDIESIFLVYGGAVFELPRNSTDYEIITIAYRSTFHC